MFLLYNKLNIINLVSKSLERRLLFMIEIKQVTTKRQLKKFIQFPVKLLNHIEAFTPYIYEDEMDNLRPKTNPAFSYCDVRLFLAYKDGKIVGRIAAILNHRTNEKYNEKRIRFNRIDMIDDFEVTKALIKAVADFGKQFGMEEIVGPLGFNDQDKEGLLIAGFEYHNMFVTFYHPPYYVEHFRKLGFVEDAIWNEYRIEIPKEVPPRLSKLANFTKRTTGVKFLEFKNKRYLKKHQRRYILEALELVDLAYADLYGYIPNNPEQLEVLVDQYIPLVDLDFVSIIVDENDKVIAMGLMIPTPVFALKKHNGKLLPFGVFSVLRALKKSDVLDMLLVAVHPDYQKTGVITLIFERSIENAIKRGIRYAETGPELVTNVDMTSLWKHMNPNQHKKRAAFIAPITLLD